MHACVESCRWRVRILALQNPSRCASRSLRASTSTPPTRRCHPHKTSAAIALPSSASAACLKAPWFISAVALRRPAHRLSSACLPATAQQCLAKGAFPVSNFCASASPSPKSLRAPPAGRRCLGSGVSVTARYDEGRRVLTLKFARPPPPEDPRQADGRELAAAAAAADLFEVLNNRASGSGKRATQLARRVWGVHTAGCRGAGSLGEWRCHSVTFHIPSLSIPALSNAVFLCGSQFVFRAKHAPGTELGVFFEHAAAAALYLLGEDSPLAAEDAALPTLPAEGGGWNREAEEEMQVCLRALQSRDASAEVLLAMMRGLAFAELRPEVAKRLEFVSQKLKTLLLERLAGSCTYSSQDLLTAFALLSFLCVHQRQFVVESLKASAPQSLPQARSSTALVAFARRLASEVQRRSLQNSAGFLRTPVLANAAAAFSRFQICAARAKSASTDVVDFAALFEALQVSVQRSLQPGQGRRLRVRLSDVCLLLTSFLRAKEPFRAALVAKALGDFLGRGDQPLMFSCRDSEVWRVCRAALEAQSFTP